MKHYTSISDFLEAHGYTAQADGYCRDEGDGLKSCIPPGEWQGLTVETFMRMAKEKGWVQPPLLVSDEGIGRDKSKPLHELLSRWGYAIPPGATVTRLYMDGKEISINCGYEVETFCCEEMEMAMITEFSAPAIQEAEDGTRFIQSGDDPYQRVDNWCQYTIRFCPFCGEGPNGERHTDDLSPDE